MLRSAGRRGRSTLRSVPPSSLAGGGGGVGPTARSSRSSGSCATSMTAAFSERAPKRRSFRVRTIARKLSFSASSASTIATRRAGSEGTSSGRICMLQSYRIGARLRVLGKHRYEVGDPVVSSKAGEQGDADVHHARSLRDHDRAPPEPGEPVPLAGVVSLDPVRLVLARI